MGKKENTESMLKKLFDYQRFEQNSTLARLIENAEGGVGALSDDELGAVCAAGESDGSTGESGFTTGAAIDLIGEYAADSYGGGGGNSRAIGWDGLALGRVFTDGRSCPYEIKKDGTTIGWAPLGSIRLK